MSRALVAFFSASGVTAAVAERLADSIGADIFEIRPAIPYTEADLDWRDEGSRSSVEMKNPAYRPAVAEFPADIGQYDTVYVGFPIWWYIAPTVINTFLEGCELAGKRVIPFATSGSSGMGRTNEHLAASCRGAELSEGRRFDADVTAAELSAWAGAAN